MQLQNQFKFQILSKIPAPVPIDSSHDWKERCYAEKTVNEDKPKKVAAKEPRKTPTDSPMVNSVEMGSRSVVVVALVVLVAVSSTGVVSSIVVVSSMVVVSSAVVVSSTVVVSSKAGR